ncbi:hypothetical protein [Aliiroseovarius sp.]|uniref:hypothetical protein n=1 Tax=Aliiroseovarius sp. TaxID=1872442 RepID=UPI003BADA0E0
MRIYLIGGAVVLSLAVASNLAFGGLVFDSDHHGRDRGWHDRFEHQMDGWTERNRGHWFEDRDYERDDHRRN